MDHARKTAFDPTAPTDERVDALGQVQREFMPTASDLLPPAELRDVIAHIEQGHAEQSVFHKALVIPFPSDRTRRREPGMQSVSLDERQIGMQNEWWERPSALNFDSLRAMVDQTPVLSGVVFTRVRQVQRFCGVAESDTEVPGFEIRHIDRKHILTESEQSQINDLQRFIQHCGWEFKPRLRKKLKRDSFAQFMGKICRDSLAMDSVGIETEWKNSRKGLDGFYALDGATMRLCADGFRGNPDIFAVQVVQGTARTQYTVDDLIYEPRNPRTNVASCGYGYSETELLIKIVTGFLNALTYNSRGFDANSIPKGVLHFSGNYSDSDIAEMRRYWNSMVRGVNNAWVMPIMVSKDQQSRAAFEKFGIDFSEMAFSKWMTFLVSIICAIYGMSPAEINFDAFSGGNTSPLSGSDTAEKLAASKDSGLRPLLAYFQSLLTDYVICEFNPDFAFRWTGLDPDDQDKRHELKKMVTTVNEIRAELNYEALDSELGDAPLNPSLVGPWMQVSGLNDPGPGDPGAEGAPEGDAAGDPGGVRDFGAQQGFGGADAAPGQDFGKAFGLPPVWSVDGL